MKGDWWKVHLRFKTDEEDKIGKLASELLGVTGRAFGNVTIDEIRIYREVQSSNTSARKQDGME